MPYRGYYPKITLVRQLSRPCALIPHLNRLWVALRRRCDAMDPPSPWLNRATWPPSKGIVARLRLVLLLSEFTLNHRTIRSDRRLRQAPDSHSAAKPPKEGTTIGLSTPMLFMEDMGVNRRGQSRKDIHQSNACKIIPYHGTITKSWYEAGG